VGKKIDYIKSKIEKKDLAYWVIILAGTNILAFTGRLAHDTTLLNYVSFAGTVTSIILAVVAIIYSYYQSSTFENTTSKLENSADVINDVTEELRAFNIETLTNDVKTTIDTVDNKLIALNETIHNIEYSFSQVTSSLENQVHEIQNGFGYFRENFQSFHNKADLILDSTMSLSMVKYDNKQTQSRNDINMIVKAMPVHGVLFFYYVVKAASNNIALNTTEFISLILDKNLTPWSNEWVSEAPRNDIYLATYGYYTAYIVHGIYNNWFEPGEGDEFKNLDINFVEAVLERAEIEINTEIINLLDNLINN